MNDQVRLVGLLDVVADAVVGVGADGTVLLANRSCELLFGYGPAELLGRPARMLFATNPHERPVDLWEELVRDPGLRRATQRITAWHQRKDGSRFTGETAVSWVGHDSGVAMIAATHDLTDLRQAQSRYEALLEAAPDAIIGVRGDGCIVLMNAAAERLLGYQREALIGSSYEVILPPDDRERIGEEIQRAFSTPDPDRAVQVDVLHADGTMFPTESVIARFGEGPDEIIISSIRDLRARRAAEAERRQLLEEVERQKAEQVTERAQRLEAIGQLAGGVAHDFNNLLSVIINYASLAGEELDELLPTNAHRLAPLRGDVDRIQRAAEGGVALTRQLLAVGRRDVSRPQVLSINAVVRELEHLLQTSVGQHIGLRLRLYEDLWATRMDRGHIEQILVNLAVNARDAMPSGGDLVVDTANLVVTDGGSQSPAPAGRYVTLRVSDTGTGMPPEVVARLFEPFFTTKGVGRGTGLGMAMVHGIVTQSGGVISIDSRPGVGTRVSVLLPATDEAPATAGPAASPPRRRRHETVLLADDEAAIREVATRVLTRQGYRVLAAADGPAAIDLAKHHVGQIDLLLTDVIMPGMLGKEVAERVSELIPAIRVVFMSGYAQSLLASDGSIDDGVTLLEKPFTPTVLFETLHVALRDSTIPSE